MNPCTVPVHPKDLLGDGRWQSMHNRYVQEAKEKESEVVFIGDSIIQQLQFSTLWTDKINSLHCFNFGIGGDRVEHVLWRIQNGEFDFNVKIKAVVLFVGTNNTDCAPKDVFEGIVGLVEAIRDKLGDVAIVLPTLLPRGQHPNPPRAKNEQVNALLMEKYHRNNNNNNNPDEVDASVRNVHLVPIHRNILQADETISHHIMHDYLHLTDTGYTKVFGPVYEKLCDILGK